MDVFGLSAKLVLDSSQYERGLNSSESLGRRFANSISAKTVAIGQMIGNFATSAISKTASVIKSTIGDSIQAYADYEQLVGGIETLFGTNNRTLAEYQKAIGITEKSSKNQVEKSINDYAKLQRAQDTVMRNAEVAYRTAGMDMNTYMETVTGISASLINSLDGDTGKAAEIANMAIVDMSDNANKMGTNIESIRNAYMGFSKSNFMMLDNLKLGYGGTRTEMQRLLKDAEKIQKANGKNVKYNIKNLSDIYEAIHVIQTEMGITGTTAAEADKTISGSIASMKAAWTNLMIAFGDPNADLGVKVDELMKSVKTVTKNLFPVFKRVLRNVWDGLTNAASQLPALVFGTKEDGTVNWPTWDTVKASALQAWETIKGKALEFSGLVFGKKEDGTVDWPTWESVQASASAFWENVKKNILEFSGLIFGKKEDGTVNWPTWESVQKSASAFWETVKANALKFTGLVFGTKEDGTVAFPDWSTVGKEAGRIWNDIRAQVAKFGGLVFGADEEGNVKLPTAQEVVDKAMEVYNEIKTNLANAITRVGQITFEIGDGLASDTGITQLRDFGEWLSSNGSTIIELLEQIGVQFALIKISSATVAGINTLQTFFTTLSSIMNAGFVGNITTIGGTLATAVGKIPLLSIGLWLLIPALIQIVKDLEKVQQGWELFKTTAQNAIDAVTSKVEEIKLAVSSAVDSAWKKLQGFVNDLASGKLFTNISENVRNGIAKFFNDTFGWQIPMFDMNGDNVTVDMSGVTKEATEASNAIDLVSLDLEKLDGSKASATIDVKAKVPTLWDIVRSIFGGGGGNTSENNTSGGNADSFARRHGYNAKGMWDVPYNGYVSELHRGEMVLNASRAREYREKNSGAINAHEIATQVSSAIKEAMQDVVVRSYLSSKDITDDVSRNTTRALKARRFAT